MCTYYFYHKVICSHGDVLHYCYSYFGIYLFKYCSECFRWDRNYIDVLTKRRPDDNIVVVSGSDGGGGNIDDDDGEEGEDPSA